MEADRMGRKMLVIYDPPASPISRTKSVIPYFVIYEEASSQERDSHGARVVGPLLALCRG